MAKLLNFEKYKSFEIRSKADKAEIILYGAIGESWFEESISAKKFSDELKALPDTINELEIRINSPGGEVFDGITIYNRIKQHKAKKKRVYIDGLAASIASIIALAGDEVIMGEGALFMVHLPHTISWGNRNDFENIINRLMDIEEQMVSIYTKKTKMSRSEIKAMLEKETWLDAEQAKDLGFIDSKFENSIPIAASVLDKATWINKKPAVKNSETAVAKKEIGNFKKELEKFLSR